ncbi:hypothetical protein B0H66DRAFT_642332 [Apodospora peruviana]|uniref:Uncharacterized protein n=1 Tax=Apodospora peruviana TaxID=516989 RepID=A0AAE0HZX9_9PEZI|nr:hypothetical protein B0H66DRAFT_642332 [Apodospora peruviana]
MDHAKWMTVALNFPGCYLAEMFAVCLLKLRHEQDKLEMSDTDMESSSSSPLSDTTKEPTTDTNPNGGHSAISNTGPDSNHKAAERSSETTAIKDPWHPVMEVILNLVQHNQKLTHQLAKVKAKARLKNPAIGGLVPEATCAGIAKNARKTRDKETKKQDEENDELRKQAHEIFEKLIEKQETLAEELDDFRVLKNKEIKMLMEDKKTLVEENVSLLEQIQMYADDMESDYEDEMDIAEDIHQYTEQLREQRRIQCQE